MRRADFIVRNDEKIKAPRYLEEPAEYAKTPTRSRERGKRCAYQVV
jgi:hypothetical protein